MNISHCSRGCTFTEASKVIGNRGRKDPEKFPLRQLQPLQNPIASSKNHGKYEEESACCVKTHSVVNASSYQVDNTPRTSYPLRVLGCLPFLLFRTHPTT